MRRSELTAAGATSRPRLAELPPPSDTDHLPPAGLYPSRGNCQFPLKTSEMGSQNQNQVYTYTNTLYCGTSKRQIRLY